VATQVFEVATYNLAKPVPYFRAVHIIVVDPILFAGIVRRIDVDAFDLTGVVG
jgi:hypothetical protein